MAWAWDKFMNNDAIGYFSRATVNASTVALYIEDSANDCEQIKNQKG